MRDILRDDEEAPSALFGAITNKSGGAVVLVLPSDRPLFSTLSLIRELVPYHSVSWAIGGLTVFMYH
jgi:hypothetical protein